ncbi:hypothetical protein WA158_007064 [Blastocystis sp. Blastoise]
MSATETSLNKDRYLFSFQDETQLWVPREFIEKYCQFPFYDIIGHSEKYGDGSYYIDMLPFHIEKVISFLMEDNVDVSSLNLRDSYDIYKTLIEYSVVINDEFQSDLLFHLKELFYNYLKDNNYDIYEYDNEDVKLTMTLDLYSSNKKEMHIKGLITPQRKDELLYYSLLIKMIYDYSSNIPLEYIYPTNIQDIFPSLKELHITVNTHYKKTELLLNPNSDEYIIEYIRLYYNDEDETYKPRIYNYYTESEMNEYNKISSLDLNKIYYSYDLIDSVSERRDKNVLHKIYKYIVNEAIYTNDYSQVEISETNDEYILIDTFKIEYDDKINDKTLYIIEASSKLGISQLLLLPSYLSISEIILHTYSISEYNSVLFMKLFEEGLFDSITTLNVDRVNKLTNIIDENLFDKIMTTHIFSNVTKLIYDNDESFQLSLINPKNFPKLHIINYNNTIATDNFDSLFPVNLISIIDTIRINEIDSDEKEEVAILLDDLAYTHSIHIVGINKNLFDSCRSDTIKTLDIIKNYKHNIDCLHIAIKDDDNNDNNNDQGEIDKRNALETFLKSNVLEHLNCLNITFFVAVSLKYLEWISTLFDDNKFNTIHELEINLISIKKDSLSECLNTYENLLEKLIPKASIVSIEYIEDIPDDNFFKLFTIDNFPQLRSITFCNDCEDWWEDLMNTFCRYMNNNNFPSSSTIRLTSYYSYDEYINNSYDSILRCKYDSHKFIDAIMGTNDETMSQYEIETLFECINENKTQHIRNSQLYIYDDEQLIKLVNFISTGKIPKLKEFIFYIDCDISTEQLDMYKQQLNDSSFIQENHVNYELEEL